MGGLIVKANLTYLYESQTETNDNSNHKNNKHILLGRLLFFKELLSSKDKEKYLKEFAELENKTFEKFSYK